MSVLGASTLVRLALPTGIDAGEVLKFELQSGMTAEDVIRRAALAMGVVNTQIANKYNGLFRITNSMFAYSVQGQTSRTKTPRATEGGKGDPVRTEAIGQMLPFFALDDWLAWTAAFIAQAPQEQLDGDVTLISDRFWNRVGSDFWTRAMTATENLIGTSGYDVPWVIGTGTNVDYIPPQYRGYPPFTAAHTHFLFKDDDSNDWADLWKDMMVEMRHHGHSGMLSLFISPDDITEARAVDGFVRLKPQQALVIGSGSDNPTNPMMYMPGTIQGVPGELVGYFECEHGWAEIRTEEYIPTNYCFMTKSYGQNHPKNGLALRINTNLYPGFGLMVKPTFTRHLIPELESVEFAGGFGIGVNDRTNGVCGYLASGAAAWVDPDID